MRPCLFAVALAAAASSASATDVGVSVSIAQPGLYGRIDIGSAPRPALIYAEPMIVQPMPYGVARQPIYLHVPPGHAKDWRKHCGKYNACGQPVYFVQERWYNDVYMPRYREDHARGRGRDDDQGRGRGPKHERKFDRDDDRGHGRGQGRGRND